MLLILTAVGNSNACTLIKPEKIKEVTACWSTSYPAFSEVIGCLDLGCAFLRDPSDKEHADTRLDLYTEVGNIKEKNKYRWVIFGNGMAKSGKSCSGQYSAVFHAIKSSAASQPVVRSLI